MTRSLRAAGSEGHDVVARRFGRAVRRLRQQRGWSQEVLAARAELNRSYMGEIELNVGNDYGGKATDVTIPYATAVTMSETELANATAAAIETNKKLIYGTGAEGETRLLKVLLPGQTMSRSYVGDLVRTYGKVTKVEYDNNGVIGAIHVSYSGGTAIVFLDGYINCDDNCTLGADGYHDLSWVKVGAYVEVTGIASIGQNSYDNSEQIGARIRVRNRADIKVWSYTEDTEYPKTGDSTTFLMVALTLVLAAAGVSMTLIAKRRLNQGR